jgi:hypothetical protein
MTLSRIRFAPLVAALLLLAGCPVPSLQTVSPAGTPLSDRRVLGQWTYQDDGKDGAAVTVSEKNGACDAAVDDKGTVTHYPVKLFKVGDATYLESSSIDDERKRVWWLARIEIGDDRVQLFTWDDAKYGDLFDNPAVQSKTLPSGTKLDMDPANLADFLKANSAKFSKPDMLFVRKP